MTRYAPASYSGIVAARLIVAGDIDGARRWIGHGPRAWRVAEYRAIVGACRKWGIDAAAILFPDTAP